LRIKNAKQNHYLFIIKKKILPFEQQNNMVNKKIDFRTESELDWIGLVKKPVLNETSLETKLEP
jgi:hypothetical protein